MVENIFLVRHAQSLWNEKNVKQCLNDYWLSRFWEQQAQSINLWYNIDSIFSSPYKRARQTAEIIAKNHSFPEVNIIYDNRLREREVFNEKNNYKLTEQNRQAINPYLLRYPADCQHGEKWESFLDIHNRLFSFLSDYVLNTNLSNICIVSHAAAINHIIHLLLFWHDWNSEKHYNFITKFSHIKNASITKIIYKNDKFLIDCFNA